MRCSTFAWCLVFALTAACGARTVSGADEGEGEGEGEAGTGGSTGESGGDGDGDGDGDGELCEDLDDAPEGESVRVRITNAGGRPVFVLPVSECQDEYYEILRDASYWPPGYCDPSCADLAAGQCACPPGCGLPPLIRIEVGSTLTRPWPQLLRVPHAIAAECTAAECQPGECTRARAAESGPHTLRVHASRLPPACDPEQGGDIALCACTPNDDGWCEVFVDPPPNAAAVEQEFQVPLAGVLEIVLE